MNTLLAVVLLTALAWAAYTGRIPRWCAVIVAGGLAVVALLGRRRTPAPPPPTEPVRKTAADRLARREAERQAAISAAEASPEREREIATLMDARARRRR